MLWFLLLSCGVEKEKNAKLGSDSAEEALPFPQSYERHPETPLIMRDVALIDDDVEFTQPYVPGHRTTMDGRIAVRVQGGPPGPEINATHFSFYLFVPERLQEPILSGPPGAEILSNPEPWSVPFSPALDPEVTRLGHHAICDATTDFPQEGEHPNPYTCGEDGRNDCYDVTVISTTSKGIVGQLWGTPVTVEVANPKTPAAAIVNVETGTPIQGSAIPYTLEFTEPAVTSDGRLLTGRLGAFPRTWTNPETGESFYRSYDLAYSQLPDDADPCDVRGWTDFHPMSHAPYDSRMVGTYGLAAYPFRDTEGKLIPDGEDMGGTYPWVDREGANVFMTGVHGRLVEQSTSQYPRSCVSEQCDGYTENIDWDRGFMVGGLWTHGKMVHLDGLINNIDWAVGVTPDAHYMVDLYKDQNGEAVPVRFGSGRFAEEERLTDTLYPAGYTHNANIMDSLQNLFNWQPKAVPITPNDVVWVMSSGVATDEIVFDDFVNPNAFIVSNMQASITQLYNDAGESTSIPLHNNGQVREYDGLSAVLATLELQPEAFSDIHLQNGSTSLLWNVPAYGLVTAGTARVEPVALGGIKGRGFWLSGYNEIRYEVPEQDSSIRETPWTVGIHVDPRYAENEVHTLLTWPDGSHIRLLGRSVVQYVVSGQLVHEIDLPETAGWMHLGWRIAAGNQQVTFLLDGMALDEWGADEPVFEMVVGDFVVGKAGDVAWGFRGWIDNLRVLASDVNPEVACNHAGGTMLRVENQDILRATEHVPQWAHRSIASRLGDEDSTRYACYTDHSDDYAAHLGNIPENTEGIREEINFPEGPIYFGEPRPDSSSNGFCLSCHSSEGKGGLSLEALRYDASLNAEDDPRRQPSQPPRRVFGNIPGGWIPSGQGPGSPNEHSQAPTEGVVMDHWLLPRAN